MADNCDDPCANALCPLYPTARCEPRRCGTCRVVFFDANRDEIKDCCGKAQSGTRFVKLSYKTGVCVADVIVT